ncbi:MAG: hypothetical protein ACLFN4_06685 [Candidatus Acetothermia bacterium]
MLLKGLSPNSALANSLAGSSTTSSEPEMPEFKSDKEAEKFLYRQLGVLDEVDL